MIGPGMPPPLALEAAMRGDTAMDPTAAAVWRERERRQRTIRLLMMFLVMLLLMDGEDSAQRQHSALRKKHKKTKKETVRLEETVFASRQRQEQRIRQVVANHARFEALVHKNGGENVEESVLRWAEHQAEQEKDQFAEHASEPQKAEHDPEDDRKVFHYPWNSTGFYRGEWSRQKKEQVDENKVSRESQSPSTEKTEQAKPSSVVLDAVSLEQPMLKLLRERNESLGVFILPEGFEIEMRDDNNLTSMHWEELRTDSNNAIVRREVSEGAKKALNSKKEPPGITLTYESGRAAFQLFSRSIPSMKEISIVDGFVKLYDSTSPGYSTRKDILLRVRGVLIHAIGRLSLVSNVDVSRSALVIEEEDTRNAAEIAQRRRRLLDALSDFDESKVETVRDEALALFSDDTKGEEYEWSLNSPDFMHRRLDQEGQAEGLEENETVAQSLEGRRTLETPTIPSNEEAAASSGKENTGSAATAGGVPAWSDVVLPYPFVRDDKKETIRRTKTPAARMMPNREQALEANAAGCGFEINMDIGEVEWTVGAWRKLVGRRVNELKRLDPSVQQENDNEEEETLTHLRGARSKPIQDQALVITMVGTIRSPNCDFTAILNATALRTDWETTTSRAINYSFVMMLVCLTQILILLRQLLHSQGQSAATRVSLLCIGWQTLIDALLCLGHIYLSLSIQPLFSAFASVSFFKLLIFCVIEMKYMAIIIQARNSSNGGQTTEVLRRQIAMLHLRFYSAMAGSFLLFFYIGDKYRLFYMLALYSFWVPQILMNIVTEAKSPMHSYYIYGMSLTRLVAPLYIFSVRNNFLKEVNPEAPYDPFMCQMLVLWVGLQTVILIGQSKYGARFMIPARFLPPKFDYSRPLPACMLPPGALELPTIESMEDREDCLRSSHEREALVVSSESTPPSRGRHTTAVTTRNRMRGNRATRSESGMMKTEEHHSTGTSGGNGSGALSSSSSGGATPSAAHTLECSICYEQIDVRKRHDYMLAPCNHIFHRECLVQWMDVKMECPICRTDLPAL